MKKCYILFFVILLSCFVSLGCSKHVDSTVSATAEEGYSPSGQSVSIGPLPSGKEQEPLPDLIVNPLKAALTNAGYVVQEQGSAQVHVRVYWQSVGPYITIKENPLWDFGFGGRGPWQRERYIKEEKYLRTLIVEAWSNELAQGESDGLAPFLQKPLSYADALSYLPAKPARLLWRVQSQNVGNLKAIEGVLPDLLHSALPWIARSVDVKVMVPGDATTNIEALD